MDALLNTACTELKTGRNYAKFEISPLPRGMGTTLGNALRRIMLMNLSGFAATWVKIDGVASLYDPVIGVEENMLDIALNVKNVTANPRNNINKKVVVIDAEGPCKICAFDIQDEEMAVINSNQPIVTVREGHCIHMEIGFEAGKGYGNFESHMDCPDAAIPLDSMYSPARRVNYYVEPTRVGDCTDFDKLTMEIWSDGTMSPKEIMARSAELLRQNLFVFGFGKGEIYNEQ